MSVLSTLLLLLANPFFCFLVPSLRNCFYESVSFESRKTNIFFHFSLSITSNAKRQLDSNPPFYNNYSSALSTVLSLLPSIFSFLKKVLRIVILQCLLKKKLLILVIFLCNFLLIQVLQDSNPYSYVSQLRTLPTLLLTLANPFYFLTASLKND
jgi:hypothetical protein